MEYSPRCAIPYVSTVDAGTLELVRSTGVEIASSANLIQYFEARWDDEQLKDNFESASHLHGRLLMKHLDLFAGK
jgi:Xaa-Pro dipeptidase